jgi:hypothetical protein
MISDWIETTDHEGDILSSCDMRRRGELAYHGIILALVKWREHGERSKARSSRRRNFRYMDYRGLENTQEGDGLASLTNWNIPTSIITNGFDRAWWFDDFDYAEIPVKMECKTGRFLKS